ncbi:hypothetical protein LCGC14_0808070 [marine sediment metagenome]|uniref:Portal protein n=1 Tax=marine sediment metagenome TaxID=412755 RepID=A0A0F9S7M4_9ZZZZ
MALDAGIITAQVSTKESELKDRTNRQDRDFKRWQLETTTKRDSLRDNDIDIVSNGLRTFADEVHSKLASADMTIAVRLAEAEGDDKRDDVGKLERLLQFAFEKGDERLISLLLPPLRDFTIWCASIRGWVAGRYLVRKEGNDVIFDLMPWDPRWVTYEVNKWRAYKTFRSREELEEDYKKKINIPLHWFNPFSKTPNNLAVIDYWKYEKKGATNAVVCNNTFLKEPKHYDISMPVLLMPIATSPLIRGLSQSEDENYGDSIFAPIRDISKKRDQFGSIIATHANLRAKQPLLHYHDAGIPEIKSTIQTADGVLNLVRGKQEIKPTPMEDIAPTVIEMFNWFEREFEKGSLPTVGINNPNPQSGTLQNLVQEARNIVFNPQLRLLNTYYAGICRLIEEQLISNGIKVDVQTIQDNKYYTTQVTPVDLKKPHIIKVEFSTGTPWSQMDKAQQAQMLRDLGLPIEWVWENILKIQDPKMLGDLAAIELFEHSPKGAKKKAAEALIRLRGDEVAAESLVRELDREETQEDMAIEQMAFGGEEEPPEGF